MQTIPPGFDEKFAHRKAMANGILLHYVIGGTGTPVLLLHGWLGTWYSWRKIMPALAEHYTVIAPDMRGYGDSSKPYTGYDGRNLKEDCRALLKSLGFEKAFVVGHDMGALPALLYAAEHPDEVLGLAYLDEPLPGYNLDKFTAFSRTNPFIYWWFAFNSQPNIPAMLWHDRERETIDFFLNSMIVDQRAISAADREEYRRGLRSPGGLDGSFGWYREVLTTEAQILESTQQKMSVPVLGINGEFGHPGVAEQMKLVAERVTGAVIPHCGHLIAEEQPDLLVAELLQFWRSIG